MMQPGSKTYIGDGVYVEVVHGRIILTTEYGVPQRVTNVIYLEPQIWVNLCEYISAIYKKEHIAHE